MSKKIFSFDLGTNSCGWAVIEEGQGPKIIDAGVRIVPSDPNFHGEFEKGNPASKNASRTEKRGIRRNNQRWKQRRDNLSRKLKGLRIYPSDSLMNLDGRSLYELRAKAVKEKLPLEKFSRVLLHILQKRGFLSNRKSQSEEESSSAYKQTISENTDALEGRTIGQYLFSLIDEEPYTAIRGKVFNRADYRREVDLIWDCQHDYYPEILTGNSTTPKGLYNEIVNKILFYQRPLKSQKHLVSKCTFEKNLRATPKSSPLFQSFNVLQKLNSVRIKEKGSRKERTLSDDEREKLRMALYDHKLLNKYGKLTKTKALKVIGLTPSIYQLNYDDLDGDRTYQKIVEAFEQANATDYESFLVYNASEEDMLYKIWHILHSEEKESTVIRLLTDKLKIDVDVAVELSKISFNSDYGSLSAKAIKKLLPHLNEGLQYSEACDSAGYDHSGYKTEMALKGKMELLKRGSLRNPVVEQILNQMINVTNALMEKYGRPDEVRIELARELRNSAKVRKKISAANRDAQTANKKRRTKLIEEFDYKIVNGRDVQRMRLWEETDHVCLYCGQHIQQSDFLSGTAEIEHILPKSRSANDSLSNKILSHYRCNKEKDNATGYDYVASKGEEQLDAYVQRVEELLSRKKINYTKYKNLLCPGEDIPTDFLNRQKQDTAYIVREASKMLKSITPKVATVPGSITNYLRREWKLDRILEELNFPKYKEAGMIEDKIIKTSGGGTKTIQVVKDWSKREDQRHHALDAIIVGLVSHKMIFGFNNLNKFFLDEQGDLSSQEKEQLKKEFEEETGLSYSDGLNAFTKRRDITQSPPIDNIEAEVKKYLARILVSFKKAKNKAVSLNKNKIKGCAKEQTTIVPRGPLHEETLVGQIRVRKTIPIDTKLTMDKVECIIDPQIRLLILDRLESVNGDPKKVFSKSKYDKVPIVHKHKKLDTLDIWEYRFTKRVNIDDKLTDKRIRNIIDDRIRHLIQDYVTEKGGPPAKAFKNYLEYPIKTYLGKGEKDNQQHVLKKVKIFADGNYTSTRTKTVNGEDMPNDFVTLGNNHHALIYQNDEGVYSSKLVSLWDAVAQADINFKEDGKLKSVIDKTDSDQGRFVFSLQINDLVLIDIPIDDRDRLDQLGRNFLSERLFRVQSIASAGKGLDIFYRHHLETRVDKKDLKELRNITWERIQSDKHFHRLLKVRINNIGEIVGIEK